MSSLNDDELASALARIEPTKAGILVFRTVSFKYADAVDSVAGAIEHGGRFNPPRELARTACNLADGFGFLYTATNPLTSLFECGHLLRGDRGEMQSIPVEPTILVSFRVEADNLLDLRAPANQASLKLDEAALCSLDHRAVLNPRGRLTPLQALGVALYKSGRFCGLLTPSRFADLIPSFCCNFLPQEVRCQLQDSRGLLRAGNATLMSAPV